MSLAMPGAVQVRARGMSAAADPWDSDLIRVVSDLRHKSEDVRHRAVVSLGAFLSRWSSDLHGADLQRFVSAMQRASSALLEGPTAGERVGGVRVVSWLLVSGSTEREETAARLGQLCRDVDASLRSFATDVTLVTAASAVMGDIARVGGAFCADAMEAQTRRALEWLAGEWKLMGALVLKEIAENMPAVFYVHVQAFLPLASVALCDRNAAVRSAAHDALCAVLRVCATRESSSKGLWHAQLYEVARSRMSCADGAGGGSPAGAVTPEETHAALLVVDALTCHAPEFVKPRFAEVCKLCMAKSGDRERFVRSEVIGMLPKLARFDPEAFCKEVGDAVVALLLANIVKGTTEKSQSYVALGELASILGCELQAYGKAIVPAIVSMLTVRKLTADTREEALSCVSKLAKVLPVSEIETTLAALLPHVFVFGLTPPLIQSLQDLCVAFPSLLPVVQQSVFELLVQILSPNIQGPISGSSGASSASGSASNSNSMASLPSLPMPTLRRTPSSRRLSTASSTPPILVAASTEKGKVTEFDTETICLALRTISTFNFGNDRGDLLDFASAVIAPRFLDPAMSPPEVLRVAAVACSKLMLASVPKSGDGRVRLLPTRGYASTLIDRILLRMINLAVSNPDSTTRLTVLRSLKPPFDSHLSRSHHSNSLFLLLNDESFEVRQTALSIIGRLAAGRTVSSFVVPSLRSALLRMLASVEYGADSRGKEQAASLICDLLRMAKPLARAASEQIVTVLLPAVESTSIRLGTAAIKAVGELASCSPSDLRSHVAELFPPLIATLRDKTPTADHVSRREAALRTLGEISRATGFVIDPLLEYPDLLRILLDAISSERSNAGLRTQLVKLIGILGAVDPYRHRETILQRSRTDPSNSGGHAVSSTCVEVALPFSIPVASPEYNSLTVMQVLMRILKDPNLVTYHKRVMDNLALAFQALGKRCISHLRRILPPFLEVLRCAPTELRGVGTDILALVTSMVESHVREYAEEIGQIMCEFWSEDTLASSLALLEYLSLALSEELKGGGILSKVMPKLLRSLHAQVSARVKDTRALSRLIECLEVIGSNLDEHIHLLVPPLALLIERVETPPPVAREVLRLLARLGRVVDISSNISVIMHSVLRLLERPMASKELREGIVESLSLLAKYSPQSYSPFVVAVRNALERQAIPAETYSRLSDALASLHAKGAVPVVPLSRMSGVEAAEFVEPPIRVKPTPVSLPRSLAGGAAGAPNSGGSRRMSLNTKTLLGSWETTSQRTTTDDWVEWLRQFTLSFLRESPSPSLRSCHHLAQEYHPVVKDLFGPAFMSVWDDLPAPLQKNLLRSIEVALTARSIPQDVVHTLLNLAEFMERQEKPLPIENMGNVALRCRAYAKALRYKEIQYVSDPKNPQVIEELISINNQLQLPDAATGVLTAAQRKHAVQLQEAWYEKLGRWRDAQRVYERKLAEDPKNATALLGTLRCLEALGEHTRVGKLAAQTWESATPEMRREVAPIAAESAWCSGSWESMAKYVEQVPPSNAVLVGLLKAVLAVHGKKFDVAQRLVDETRGALDVSLAALAGESYDRAYFHVVRATQLAELEEVIQHNSEDADPSESEVADAMRKRIKGNFAARLKGAIRDVDVWQQLLRIQELSVDPRQDSSRWIKFAGLCRKQKRPSLAMHTIECLAGRPLSPDAAGFPLELPRVAFEYSKLLWSTSQSTEEKWKVLRLLCRLRDCLQADDQKVLARIHLKAGEWRRTLAQLEDNATREDVAQEILGCFRTAVQHGGTLVKSLRAWALVNCDLVAAAEGKPDADLLPSLTAAMHALIRSIALSGQRESVQDVLRLLTLTYKHGHIKEIEHTFLEAVQNLNIRAWLSVIPQIIARLHSSVPSIQRVTKELVVAIGRSHPQALLYSLTVASKSHLAQRATAARSFLDTMRSTAGILVDQAMTISHELVRASVVWHEMWWFGINEASRLCYEEKNTDDMWAVLLPLYKHLDRGAESPLDESFIQAYGADLSTARQWVRQYQKTHDFTELQRAWDIYYNVYGLLDKSLKQTMSIEVRLAAPKLVACKDLQLAVPGTYKPDEPTITIRSLALALPVISSKQRPRRLTMMGSNGVDYLFLLKAHEDLRQDERAMQLFSLMNTLLSESAETARDHLGIVSYAVVPLSPNSGLIGWVLHSDTFHELIKEYRESKKIVFDNEFKLLKQKAPPYDPLTAVQKAEVLQWILEETDGMDFKNVLWQRSPSAEIWLQRRTNYTRSLAVMSMVGHVLGVGDRHPSNLMLDRDTGHVIHIDFGECFETAMHRQLFPERIPFRLTRMLVNAMEVSGAEGTFRLTCEKVMSLIRRNKDNLLAMLETFVYDPLINWRLMQATDHTKQAQSQLSVLPCGEGSRNASIRSWLNNDDIILHIGETPGGSIFHPVDPESAAAAANAGANSSPGMRGAATPAPEPVSDAVNERAVTVMRRVIQKLAGREASRLAPMDVPEQVEYLINQATAHENLAACYRGWCSFW